MVYCNYFQLRGSGNPCPVVDFCVRISSISTAPSGGNFRFETYRRPPFTLITYLSYTLRWYCHTKLSSDQGIQEGQKTGGWRSLGTRR